MEDEKAPQYNSLLKSQAEVMSSKEKYDEQRLTFTEKLKIKSYRDKVYQSLAVFFIFFAFGFQVGQRGPSFLDLQQITQTDMQKASTFFTATAVGMLGGALVVGLLLDRFNKSLVLLIGTFILAATVSVIPLCSQYELMLVILVVNAFCMGWLNAGTNSFLLHVWGSSEGRSYMQALHSIFAFGAVISPLCTAPFLTKIRPEDNVAYNITIRQSIFNETYQNSSTLNEDSLISDETNRESRLVYAFIISGLLALISSIPLFIHYLKNRSKTRQSKGDNSELSLKKDLPLGYYVLTIILVDIMFMCYCAIEDSFASYLSTFTVLQLKWPKTQGSQITSIFWASFAATRFLGIIVIRYVKPGVILLVCGVSVIVNFTAFLFCSYYLIYEGVWVFTVTIGFSMAVIFPTGLSWIQENIIIITGKVSSSILIAASVGMMFNPLTVGYLMQTVSPMWFCYLFVIEIGCFISIALIFLFFSKKVLPKVRILNHKTIVIEKD